MNLQNATFLVTGGGSGLGAASVRELVRAGGNCIIADVNEEAGRALAGELGAAARFVRTDVTDEKSVQAAVDEALRSYGSLRGAVNCAGIGVAARVLGREGVHDLALSRASSRSTWSARSTSSAWPPRRWPRPSPWPTASAA